jgi:hypothetical protein
LRRRSALARFLVREAAWLRRAVQAVDVANVMRDKRLGWARQLAGRFPALRRLVRSIRATAS